MRAAVVVSEGAPSTPPSCGPCLLLRLQGEPTDALAEQPPRLDWAHSRYGRGMLLAERFGFYWADMAGSSYVVQGPGGTGEATRMPCQCCPDGTEACRLKDRTRS